MLVYKQNHIQELDSLNDFIKGIWLEFFAAHHLNNALKTFSRKNYRVYVDVKVHRREGAYQKDFQLDVVAVLGYQVVVISCTTTGKTYNEERIEALLKSKGMEAIHRSRQLGGDEARSILLCGADIETAKKI